jgi:hypothetical protein
MSQPFSPAELLAASQLCERWRQAIEIEVAAHPAARAALNGAFCDLCVARNTLADCAAEIERYLASRPALPAPMPPRNPEQTVAPFAHLRGAA